MNIRQMKYNNELISRLIEKIKVRLAKNITKNSFNDYSIMSSLDIQIINYLHTIFYGHEESSSVHLRIEKLSDGIISTKTYEKLP